MLDSLLGCSLNASWHLGEISATSFNWAPRLAKPAVWQQHGHHLWRRQACAACVRYRVLDECDEMLNMGFVDDVEMILNAGGSSENMQTLLFSATLPPWVKDITRRFLRKEQRVVDLVGSQKMKVWAGIILEC